LRRLSPSSSRSPLGIFARRVRGRRVTSGFLYRLNKQILQARERVISGQLWAADDALRDVQRQIRIELYGDVVLPPRERMLSRGLYRNRMPRTEE
jgi:hypothetical protein